MSRTLQGAVLAAITVAVCPSTARADQWCYPTYWSGYYSPIYYYPNYYYPVATPIFYYAPATTVMPYAQTQPAPPSQPKDPGVVKKTNKPPTVTESKSYNLGDNTDGGAFCQVGFWNVSGRDVTLTVNGKTHVVPRDRNLTLTVSRTFNWQIDGREAQSESVQEERQSHDIVIR